MTTTTKQDDNFLHDVVGTALLESSISWINDNLEPENVFDNNKLQNWAHDVGITEVFTENELSDWALENGFTKDEQ